MSFLDKAKAMLNQHDDKVDQGLDKAGEAVKGRFAGHEDKIDGFVDQAQQRTGDGDTTAAQHGDAQHGDPQHGDPQHGGPADEQQAENPAPGQNPPHQQ